MRKIRHLSAKEIKIGMSSFSDMTVPFHKNDMSFATVSGRENLSTSGLSDCWAIGITSKKSPEVMVRSLTHLAGGLNLEALEAGRDLRFFKDLKFHSEIVIHFIPGFNNSWDMASDIVEQNFDTIADLAGTSYFMVRVHHPASEVLLSSSGVVLTR